MIIIQYFILSAINVLSAIYSLFKMGKSEINFNKITILGYTFLVFAVTLMLYLDINYMKPFILMPFFMLFIHSCILNSFRKTLVLYLLLQLVTIFAEVITVLICFLLESINIFLLTESFLSLLSVTIIASLSTILMSSLKSTNYIFDKIVLITNKIEIKFLTNATLFTMVVVYAMLIAIYFQIEILTTMIALVTSSLIYLLMLYIFLREKDANKYYQEENEYLMSSLVGFEKLFAQERTNNHENKNQFIIIEEMIKNKDEKLLDYVQTIIKEIKKDDKSLFKKVKKIPSGGLQGIIYRKLIKASDLKINYDLTISKEIKQDSITDLSNIDNYNLCRIIGVILDNAIEESVLTQEKEIFISIYKDDGVIIEIANYFNNKVNIEDLGKEATSSKDKSRGHGLILVNKILEESKSISNEKIITKNIFTQIVKIKM